MPYQRPRRGGWPTVNHAEYLRRTEKERGNSEPTAVPRVPFTFLAQIEMNFSEEQVGDLKKRIHVPLVSFDRPKVSIETRTYRSYGKNIVVPVKETIGTATLVMHDDDESIAAMFLKALRGYNSAIEELTRRDNYMADISLEYSTGNSNEQIPLLPYEGVLKRNSAESISSLGFRNKGLDARKPISFIRVFDFGYSMETVNLTTILGPELVDYSWSTLSYDNHDPVQTISFTFQPEQVFHEPRLSQEFWDLDIILERYLGVNRNS